MVDRGECVGPMVRFEVPMNDILGMSVTRERAVNMLRWQEAYG
jgi:hypothetical protein